LLENGFEHITYEEAVDAARQDKLHAKEMRKQGHQKKLATLPCLTFLGPRVPPATTQSLRLNDQQLPLAIDLQEVTALSQGSTRYEDVPRLSFTQPILYVLHLFSGQRREGDIQYWIEEHMTAPLLAAYCVVVLSVDIVNDPIKGDLTRKDTLQLWIGLFRSRRAIGLIAGPPCETWTVARYMEVEGMVNPPPPLRSLGEIWGLKNLSYKHRLQVNIGNELLRATLILVVEAFASGAFAVVEHPGEPTWVPEAPSIWRSSFIRHLKDHCQADMLDFDQCTAGADSRKPTCLMSVHLPQLRVAFRALPGRGFCTHGRKPHKATLKGLAEDGTWRTAPAKQYPSTMCRTISTAVTEYVIAKVRQDHTGDHCNLPKDTCNFYTPLDPYNPDQVIGAYGLDFATSKQARTGRKTRPKPWAKPTGGSTAVEPPSVPEAGPDAGQPNTGSPTVTLTDAQIARIAANRAKALQIRQARRLDWLHTFTEVSHLVASPEQHIDPVIRAVQSIRTGATLRSRFAFGRVKPADALAVTAARLRPVTAQLTRTEGDSASRGSQH